MNLTQYTLTGVLLCAAACNSGSPQNTQSTTDGNSLEPIAQPNPHDDASDRSTAGGGSNYLTYRLDGCEREGYGVINRFNVAADTIRGQLRGMYAAGQRRLRISIFHHRGADSGTVMDSSSGRLSPQNQENLTNLLAAVKGSGFVEIEIAFHPMGPNNPHSWSSFDEGLYQENWNFIFNVRPVIAAAGIAYRIDLANEAMPLSNDPPVRTEYAKRLWNDYKWNFGKADTVGFSMTVWLADRVSQIPNVYGNDPPDVFDFHLYGSEWNKDEYTQLVDAHQKMKDMGYEQSVIIGETYFDDGTAASGIRRAINETGHHVLYVTQWPLRRTHSCNDVDVAPPTSFGALAGQGF